MAGLNMLCWLVALIASATTQLQFFDPSKGACSYLSNGLGQCKPVTIGCPIGYRVDPYYGRSYFSCGGFNYVCCVPDHLFAEATTTTTASPPTCGLGFVPPLVPDFGRPSSRILNGLNTSLGDWPYIVSIRARINFNVANLDFSTTQHACSGVILSNQWVLTHPLCCYIQGETVNQVSNNLVVVASEHDVTKLDFSPVNGRAMEQIVRVSECRIAPGFNAVNRLSDFNLNDNFMMNNNAVALLRLSQPITSQYSSSACLPSAAAPLTQGSQDCDVFDQCVILGWGYTDAQYNKLADVLKYARVQIYKNDVCSFMTRVLYQSFVRPDKTFCQIPLGTTDSCLGDQGGPVLCYDGVRWSVQGIIPFNLCSDNKYNPFVADISQYERWIQDTIRQSFTG